MTSAAIAKEAKTVIHEGCAQGKWGSLWGRRDTDEDKVVILAALPAGVPPPRHLTRLGSWGPSIKFSPTFPKSHELFVVGMGNGLEVNEALSQGLRPIPYKDGIEDDVFARLQEVVSSKSLQKRSVAIIGLGSVGSVMSLEHAKAGIRRFLLIDPDTMSINNVCRHVGDLHDLGKPKVNLVREKILARNPSAVVEAIQSDALDLDEAFWNEQAKSLDLLIAASDSPSVTLLVNALSQRYKIPCVWCGLYEQARWGHIIYSIPGETPCLQCVVSALSDIQDVAPRPERVVDYSDASEPMKAEPGLGAAISTVALCAAQISLALLQQRSGENFLLPDRTLFVFSNAPGSIFPSTAALMGSWLETSKKPDCIGCGDHSDRAALRQKVAHIVDALEAV